MKQKLKRSRVVKFTCPKCGTSKMLDNRTVTKSHWCECNPSSPYRMLNDEVTKIVSRHVNDTIRSLTKQAERERVERLGIKAYIPK